MKNTSSSANGSESRTRPYYENVEGAPFRLGEVVRVLRASDATLSNTWVGKSGVVEYFEYHCGCGQSYPHDPMIGVRFSDGKFEEFWREELTYYEQAHISLKGSRGAHALKSKPLSKR